MDQNEFSFQFQKAGEGQPGPVPVKVFVDGELYDITQVFWGQSDDPDVAPCVVIRCN